MRDTVKKINDLHQASIEQRSLAIKRAREDKKYEALIKRYNELIECIQQNFPYKLFEKRIYEIITGEEFQREVNHHEENKKHQEQISALEKIQKNVDVISQDMHWVKNDISNLKSYVFGIKYRLLNQRPLNSLNYSF